jgi:phosphoglycolate phosphatase/pyrophosphatase PpaX
MSIKGMIFDLDGTLADTMPVCIQAHRRAFEEYLGHSYSDSEIVAMFGPSEEGIIRSRAGDRAEECLEFFFDEYRRVHVLCSAPFSGVPALLDTLRSNGVPLALVTGKGPRSAAISLSLLGLERYFDQVEVGSSAGIIKPTCIRRVLAEWAVSAHEAAYVGDLPADIRSSRAAGVLAVGAAWAPSADASALRAQQADVVFESIPALQEWILKRV